jgi:adenylate kinase family enzyme
MDRVVVIGCSGAGKSVLTRELAVRTGIPAHHLDQLYWQPGWRPHPDLAAFRKTVDTIVASERWILDGGFLDSAGTARFGRADTAVILDLPTRVCLFRAVKRWWSYRGDTRPDLAPGCPEKFDLEFYRYILTYNAKQAPQRDSLIAKHFKGRLVRIQNDADKAAFLSALA